MLGKIHIPSSLEDRRRVHLNEEEKTQRYNALRTRERKQDMRKPQNIKIKETHHNAEKKCSRNRERLKAQKTEQKKQKIEKPRPQRDAEGWGNVRDEKKNEGEKNPERECNIESGQHHLFHFL